MSKQTTLSIFALICISFSGCNLLHTDDDVPRDWLGREVEVTYTVPAKVVAIWSNSVFNKVGGTPKRGLGGRVYFYDADHHPVTVDGGLSVYVYDDTNAKPNDKVKQKASRVVHFQPEEVKANFAATEFGASYSFWVPWDNVGGDRKQLSIIPVFTDATGHMIVGEQARQLLPGKEPVEVTDEYGDVVVQASHTTKYTERLESNRGDRNEEMAADQSNARQVKSSTIRLPESMQKRLSQPKPNRKSWNIQEWAKFDNSRIRSSIPKDVEPVRQADHTESDSASNQFRVSQAIASAVEPNSTADPLQVPKMKITAEDVKQFLRKPVAPKETKETVETGLWPKTAGRKSMFHKQSDRNPLTANSRKSMFKK